MKRILSGKASALRANGVAMAGATSTLYTRTPTVASDNGLQLDVVITNLSGSVTSSVATLTVLSGGLPMDELALWLSSFQGAVNARFGTTQAGNRILYTRPSSVGNARSPSSRR